VVYVGTTVFSNHVLALNARTGSLLWSYLTGDGASEPVVANGVVYVGSSDNNIYALNARTGAKLWSYPTGGPVGSSPVADGVVYVGSSDGNVYAFGLK
jgi:outer membrane protein assembly factor BamB